MKWNFKKGQGGMNPSPDGSDNRENGRLPKEGILTVAKRAVVVVAAAAVAVSFAFGGYYTLNEDTTAVITTFGKPQVVETSGLHFKIPFVQRVHRMTKSIIGMPIGYDPDYDQQNHANSENNPVSVKSESEMITKDFNFVNVDFYIEYQIVDPVQAYIHSDTSKDIIKNLAQSYIRDTVGIYNVDDVITTGKAEIQAKVKDLLSRRLEQENIGYGIYNVTIQDAQPPTDDVNNAFKAVEDAKQGMDTAINEAKKYQSEQLPAANSKADKTKQEAEAYKQQRISEAEGQTARFNDMYKEYMKYPLITKKRMFYETMEDVLPSLKVIINDSDGVQTMLPLEPFSEIIQQTQEQTDPDTKTDASAGSQAGEGGQQ
ncbi:FtsH protease activity modulator HflK [Clostridium sp. AM58-1XD]|uniref:FtsH protease activity modulator HflK n=1 Tax=Clostridium sp. AM58-1XD TaxID=2292307 RepID=UPI000E545E3F|nr:FtsH protease activity modulator HflK [Clostridium sp. AM58-1XD]RGZ01562.1 FtsH protease activity modulator HflK [Clostridium sp. AM58-1XD]